MDNIFQEFNWVSWAVVALIVICLVLLIVQAIVNIRVQIEKKKERKRLDIIAAKNRAEEERLHKESRNLMSGYTD